MRKLLFVLGVLLVLPLSGFAQAFNIVGATPAPNLFALAAAVPQQGPPAVNLSWDNVSVPTPAALTFKVERAGAAAGPFVQISNPAGTTYSDTTVTRGQTYFYRVRSSCPTTGNGCGTAAQPFNGDSGPSNVVTAVVPGSSQPPPVPTNLTIISIAFNHLTPKKDQIVAQWVDTASPSMNSLIILSDNRLVKKAMNLTSADGHYTFTWSGKSLAVNARLLICNTDGKCDMREIVL